MHCGVELSVGSGENRLLPASELRLRSARYWDVMGSDSEPDACLYGSPPLDEPDEPAATAKSLLDTLAIDGVAANVLLMWRAMVSATRP